MCDLGGLVVAERTFNSQLSILLLVDVLNLNKVYVEMWKYNECFVSPIILSPLWNLSENFNDCKTVVSKRYLNISTKVVSVLSKYFVWFMFLNHRLWTLALLCRLEGNLSLISTLVFAVAGTIWVSAQSQLKAKSSVSFSNKISLNTLKCFWQQHKIWQVFNSSPGSQ